MKCGQAKVRNVVAWSLAHCGSLKFSVDGAAIRKPPSRNKYRMCSSQQ